MELRTSGAPQAEAGRPAFSYPTVDALMPRSHPHQVRPQTGPGVQSMEAQRSGRRPCCRGWRPGPRTLLVLESWPREALALRVGAHVLEVVPRLWGPAEEGAQGHTDFLATSNQRATGKRLGQADSLGGHCSGPKGL